MTIKPYYYPRRSRRLPRVPVNRPKPANDDEELTGFLRGLPASDLEEIFGNALDFNKKEFAFKIEFPVSGSIDFKEVDFIVEQEFPLEVYGEIGHDSSAEQGKDLIREIFLNETFRTQGLRPLTVVWWWELQSEEQANAKVRSLFF